MRITLIAAGLLPGSGDIFIAVEEDAMKKLTVKEILAVASMLFGMFFGAGNLIFPVSMGQLAGSNMWQAAVGFLITGVGLPLLGVAALGISRKEGLLELSSMVGKRYGLLFTCALYLTIGPFFAIPRCATVSYTVGVEGIARGASHTAGLAVFSLIFFALVLFFSLRPGEIMTWIGKVLNPLFLVCLGILLIRALISPGGAISAVRPQAGYADQAFFTGLLEGYNTMDVLAGLAFGIVVVEAIRGLGVSEPGETAKSTVRAGIFSSLLMALIYLLVTVMGAQSRGIFDTAANGGQALSQIADYYFGSAGALILAATVTVACLKTAVGLITSCGRTFVKLFPGGPSYRFWAVAFSLLSFGIANLGLDTIIDYSMPVLMFLYPLAITLIALTFLSGIFGGDQVVFIWTTGFTVAGALFDFLRALPEGLRDGSWIGRAASFGAEILPFSEIGFGWVCPALMGLFIGLVLHFIKQKRELFS